MFDISDFNVWAAFTCYVVIFLFFLIVFRKKYNSFVDPLAYLLLWASSILAFLIVYIEKFGLNFYVMYFFTTMIVFITCIYFFHKDIKCGHLQYNFSYKIPAFKLLFAITFMLIVYIYSINRFIYFAISNDFISWFIFRFTARSDYNVLERMAGIGSVHFLIYFCLYAIFLKKEFKTYAWIILFLLVLQGVVSGGRSTLIGMMLSFGSFYLLHRAQLEQRFIRKVNKIVPLVVVMSILLASLVTALFSDKSLGTGLELILNRMLANADGLYYYLQYSGDTHIQSSPLEYFNSVFGIYVKQFTGMEYKNIGWQLNELVKGNLDTVEGTNFILPLQAVVFSTYFGYLYVVLIAFIFVKLRTIKLSNAYHGPFVFHLISISNILIVDIEYFFYSVLAGVLVYILLTIGLLLFDFRINPKRNIASGVLL